MWEACIVTGNSEGDGENTVKICPAYKWGRCPDYENCQYRHPPRCWKWLTHGKCSLKNSVASTILHCATTVSGRGNA